MKLRNVTTKMTKALISIDYTIDFVADEGKLTAGKSAQAISERIAQVTQEAFENGDYIFFAIDGHEEEMNFILKLSFSQVIISLGRKGVTCMVL